MSIQGGVLRKGWGNFLHSPRNFSPLMVRSGDKIASCHTRKKYEVTELGIMHPEEVPTDCLRPGQVGFVACSMKESAEG